jgi:peptidoglycan/xylan/chitin deacetylase (PgdA/CDA1 family)
VYITLALILVSAIGAYAGPVQGDRIKPFSLTGTDGKVLSWSPGRITVMSFCAFWCDTWKEQNKKLNRCRNILNLSKDDIITVSIDGRWSDVSKGKIDGPVMLDIKGALAQKLGINRVPYTLIIDETGIVRYASQGIIKEFPVINAIKSCVQSEPTDRGFIYLTFDDFPNRPAGISTTPQKEPNERLLDVLKEYDVKATFFCICNSLDTVPDLTRRLVNEGHSVQIHSWDHNRENPKLEDCISKITSITGIKPLLYRPPGSERLISLDNTSLPNLPVVNPYDYTRPGKNELKRRILMAAKPNCIILLHAGVQETIDILPKIITSLKNQGYDFRSLPGE